MAIDLEQFHQVFFEESLEGLDVMESSLMELDPNDIDSETINAIFRSAHSIKGGSATFGFVTISEFTHILETLLDQVRSGQRKISNDDINLFLQSVDCMKEMLLLIQSGESGETPQAAELTDAFNRMLNKKESLQETTSSDDAVSAPEMVDGAVSETVFWRVLFAPHEHIFSSGNDPLRNIQAVYDLGNTSICCDVSALPSFTDYDPEKLYLKWDITLESGCDKADVQDIFEWIIEDCDLTIEQTSEAVSSSVSEGSVWDISFIPGLDILRTGNEPLRLIRALSELGKIDVEANVERIPDLLSVDSESCYIHWRILLTPNSASDTSKDDILSVFEWVEDDSDVNVQLHSTNLSLSDDTLTESDQKAEHVVAEAATKADSEQATVKPVVNSDKTPVKATPKKVATETSSIRVGIDKVDNLINMVGELVITQSMLGELGTDFDIERIPKLMEGLGQLEQNTRELQESVMKIRMLPISFAFSRFPRMVRDLGQTLGKSVNLIMNGENTELDKTVMEKIGDPLVHLVRNAVDHGIETPDIRVENGKDPSGNITLNAFHQSGNVVIEIEDDGKGLDSQKIIEKAIDKGLVTERDASYMGEDQIFDLIFRPGFSTAQTVSDVSGRGVGMDVVKRNIQALSGVIELRSKPNQGSKITIKLPLTLAILDGQLVRVGSNTYIFPLTSIIESLQCKQEFVSQVGVGCKVFKLRDDYVPIVELHKAFSITPDSFDLEHSLLVVVENDGDKVGVVVDELLGQQQVVIKSLEQNYRPVDGVSGATILGDGTVALIMDIPGVVKLSSEHVGVQAESLSRILVDHDSTGLRDVSLPRTAAN